MIRFIDKDVQKYIVSKVAKNSEAIESLRKESLAKKVPIINRDVEDFIKFIIKMNKVKSILEIGTAVGYSAIVFDQIMKDGRITTIERYEKRYLQAVENIEKFNKEENIFVLFGSAEELIDSIKEKYDMIFIDAAKSHYKVYFDKSRKVLKNGGIIISDNVLFRGRVANDDLVEKRNRTSTKKMREYLDYLNEPPYNTIILPIGDGLAVTIIEEDINE